MRKYLRKYLWLGGKGNLPAPGLAHLKEYHREEYERATQQLGPFKGLVEDEVGKEGGYERLEGRGDAGGARFEVAQTGSVSVERADSLGESQDKKKSPGSRVGAHRE